MRTSFEPRIPDGDPAQRAAQRLEHIVRACGGDERAANRGALLAGLDRHLAHHFLDEQIEFRRAGGDVRGRESRN